MFVVLETDTTKNFRTPQVIGIYSKKEDAQGLARARICKAFAQRNADKDTDGTPIAKCIEDCYVFFANRTGWHDLYSIAITESEGEMKTVISEAPSMTDEIHFWGNKEKPTHVQNIEEWIQQVDDKLLYPMQKLVEELYRKTYDHRNILSEDQEDVINTVARETLDILYDVAREHGIEVWHPTADSYEF